MAVQRTSIGLLDPKRELIGDGKVTLNIYLDTVVYMFKVVIFGTSVNIRLLLLH